jgi:hypothetical protein
MTAVNGNIVDSDYAVQTYAILTQFYARFHPLS